MTTSTPPAHLPPIAVIIERPNILREKIGGSLSPTLVTKAEQAVATLSADFDQWLSDAVTVLVECWQKLQTDPTLTAETSGVSKAALEVKSLGETYGYPLVTRIAHSLFRLIVRTPANQKLPDVLMAAHVNAIRAMLRDKIKTADDPLGRALATELEKQVAEIGLSPE